jgi:hypothetical protein
MIYLTNCSLFSPWYTWQIVTCSRHDIPDKLWSSYNLSGISWREQVTICQVYHGENKLQFVRYIMARTSYNLSGISWRACSMKEYTKTNCWVGIRIMCLMRATHWLLFQWARNSAKGVGLVQNVSSKCNICSPSPIRKSLVWPHRDANPWSTGLENRNDNQ